MGHVPHLYLPPPWPAGDLPLPAAAQHHLVRVLRAGDGALVRYTDGAGLIGAGTLHQRAVRRGDEAMVERRGPAVTIAAAPPKALERARFLVEKCAELGVDRLLWLRTARGEGRLPRIEKSLAWSVAALQQSGGAHLLEVAGPVGWDDLPGVVVATPGGGKLPTVTERVTVAVGPEGGWAAGEVPPDAPTVGLGERVLRVETAAIVAATLALEAAGRLEA